MITRLNDINLRPYNTFRIDAKCSQFIEYTSVDDIPAIASTIGPDMDFINLGGGSNMLFVSDYNGVVLHSKILDIDMEHLGNGAVRIKAGSGVSMDELIERCATSGLWGLENLSGIPGNVGASAVQNVGAYGVEACDVIHTVECFDLQTNRFVKIPVEECGYGYRNSMFKNSENKRRFIISAVEFDLSTIPTPKIGYGSLAEEFGNFSDGNLTPLQIRDVIIKVRNKKLPEVDEIGSAGSFFKNPVVDKSIFEHIREQACRITGQNDVIVPHYDVSDGIKIPAAWLIDRCGLKGTVCGGAAVWDNQPLVIVNKTGNASAKDIVELENKIIETVEATFGVSLHPEVEHIGII